MQDPIPAPIKPTVSVADVEKLDIRVGTIVAVEDVPMVDRPRSALRLGVFLAAFFLVWTL